MAERRACTRLKISWAVLYHTDLDLRPRCASALDVSVGGIGIETSHRPALGDVLYISLAIHSKLIKCKGKVVHVAKQIGKMLRVGIRFEGLFKQDRLFLGAFIWHVIAGPDDTIPAKGIMIGMGLGLLLWTAILYAILALV